MIAQLGGRRFFLTMGCGIICTLLVVFDHITDTIFRDIIIGTVAAYIAGNTTQKALAKTKELADA